MHTYDLNVILDPNLNETQIQTEKTAIEAQIERVEGKIISTDEWGMKRLAYEIRKNRNGYYIIYKLELNQGAPQAIETVLRQRDNVMRAISVRHRPEWYTRKAKSQSSAAD